jgi:major membrane immunogen (membrane-anchored lipoprotein)
MFSATETVTVDSVAKVLTRLTDGTYKATYGLDDGGSVYYSMRIEHTVPAPSGFGEAHMMRLDADNYDVDGVYSGRDSAWFVMKTSDAKQDSTRIANLALALVAKLDSTNVDKLVAREA